MLRQALEPFSGELRDVTAVGSGKIGEAGEPCRDSPAFKQGHRACNVSGNPRCFDCRLLLLKWKRDFRTHDYQRPPVAGIVFKVLCQEYHWRDADTAADQERYGPFGMRNESATNRAYRTDDIAWFPVAERIETMTNGFEQYFNPTVIRIGTHDRQGPAHRDGFVALQMDETAWRGAVGTFRCLQSQHILVTWKSIHVQDGRIFHEYSSAVRLHR